jgi:hypothetical protein
MNADCLQNASKYVLDHQLSFIERMADTGINILSKEGTNIAYFAPNKTPILTKSSLKLTLSDDM